MTSHDAGRFLAALAAVAEVFERDLSDAAQMLYFDALKDLELPACLHALEQAAKNSRFMPRPSELRALIGSPSGDPELAAEAAWLLFKQLARVRGGYASVTVDDAALAETITAVFGSWEDACWIDLSPEMWASKRKEFGRVYRLTREASPEGARTLDGYCARMNRQKYGVPDPLHTLREMPDAPRLLTAAALTAIERHSVVDPHEVQRDLWRQNVSHAIAAAAFVRDHATEGAST